LVRFVTDRTAPPALRGNAVKLLGALLAVGVANAPSAIIQRLGEDATTADARRALLDSVGHAAHVAQSGYERVFGAKPLATNLTSVLGSVVAQLHHKTPEVVAAAVDVLGSCPRELVPFVKVARFVVQTLSPDLREAGIELIAKADVVSAVNGLKVALREGDRTPGEVRRGLQALRSLPVKGSQFAREVAHHHLESTDEGVRCEALLSVLVIGGQTAWDTTAQSVFSGVARSANKGLWSPIAEIGILTGAPIADTVSVIHKLAEASRANREDVLLGAEAVRLLKLAHGKAGVDDDLTPLLNEVSFLARALISDLTADQNSPERDERVVQAYAAIHLLRAVVEDATQGSGEGYAVGPREWGAYYRPTHELESLARVHPRLAAMLANAYDEAPSS
jgi:hypothetical protein